MYDWISKSANGEEFFGNLFIDMSKEKISKTELLTRGKGVITASKARSVLTKMNTRF